MSLATVDLSFRYDEVAVLDGLSLSIPEARITAIVGPNGSGKSTILKALSRLLSPRGGVVLLDGQDIQRMPTREVARRLAILPQSADIPPGVTVEQLVLHGRTPYRGLLSSTTDEDRQAVAWAIEVTNLTQLKDRPASALSGGQRQRVWIALALAQQTHTLLLDEPTTYLDLAHQADVMELVTRLNREEGRTITMVLHDLNQAARYADHIIVVQEGVPVAQGPPEWVVTVEMLRDVFGVEAEVLSDPRTGLPMCVVYGQADTETRDEPTAAAPLKRIAGAGIPEPVAQPPR